jgi:tetratricopeptide (TPR) repeat protein
MKIKGFFLSVGLLATIMSANAQKGVDNGTQYGSGEDSIRCLTNISLFLPYAKVKNFADAYPTWKSAYEECPGASKDLYLYGVQIIDWQISLEKDAAKREALVQDLMDLYDKRVKYFGNDPKYGKDWIVTRKAQDYIRLKGENADPEVLYKWLGDILSESKEETEAVGVSLYMFASHSLLEKDKDKHKGQYVQDFLNCSEIFDKQLVAAKAANNEKEAGNIEVMKTGIEKGFAGSGAADCETLESIYTKKIEENKTNIDFLKETLTLFRRVGCQESESYFAASGYVHQVEPTAESAIGLGKQAMKKEDFATAEKFFSEAADMTVEDDVKSDMYYTIAIFAYNKNNYSRAREYCRKAIDANPNTGRPYMLIGSMYASTARNIYPDDPVMFKCVFYAVVDKFEKARQVDASCAEEANKSIATYRQQFPTPEDIFMHPDLKKGNAITIGGWIGERTTIR